MSKHDERTQHRRKTFDFEFDVVKVLFTVRYTNNCPTLFFCHYNNKNRRERQNSLTLKVKK